MPEPGADTTPMLVTDMLSEAWEYLQNAKQLGHETDVLVWYEAIDALLDSPQVVRKPL